MTIGSMSRRGALCAGLGAACAPRAFAQGAPGFSAQGLAAIPPALRQMVEVGGVPGVVALIWRKGQVVQLNTVGVRDIARNLPMQRDTVFALASMTKPVTVAAALMLVEQGRMKLDDPITRWAPEFANMRVLNRPNGLLDETHPAPRAITIEDLMTHRSGITGYGLITPGPIGTAANEKLGMGVESALTPDQWMKTLAALPLAYAPGERFNYGYSIDVLGFIVGRAARTSFRQFLTDRLFRPLKMADTDFWIPPAKRDRAATIYSSTALKTFAPTPVAGFVGPRAPAYTSGGQGLLSTADDYLTFARMLLGGGQVNGVRVLKPETVRLMTTNRLSAAQRQTPPGIPGVDWRYQGFGLGVSMITDPAGFAASTSVAGGMGAFGWPGLWGGYWQADPANEMITLWLQQCGPGAPAPGTIPRLPGSGGLLQFQRLAYAALQA